MTVPGKEADPIRDTRDFALRRLFKVEAERDLVRAKLAAANTRLARLSAVIEAMDAFVGAHEQWEADLILCNKAWETKNGLPRITQELWDQAMELQAKRNVARAAKAAMEGES